MDIPQSDLNFETDARGNLTVIRATGPHAANYDDRPASPPEADGAALIGRNAACLWNFEPIGHFDPSLPLWGVGVGAGQTLFTTPRRDADGSLLGASGEIRQSGRNSLVTAPEGDPDVFDGLISSLREVTSPRRALPDAIELLRDMLGARSAVLFAETGFEFQPALPGEWQMVAWCGDPADAETPVPRALLEAPPPQRQRFVVNGETTLWLTARVRLMGRIGVALHAMPESASPRAASLALNLIAIVLERDSLQHHALERIPYDPATRMLNGQGFREEVERRFQRLEWQQLPATLLLVQCEALAQQPSPFPPDDRLGALEQIAAIIRRAARSTDIFGRVGADRFAIWMDGCDRFAGAERAERITTHGIPLILSAVIHVPLRIGMTERSVHSVITIDELVSQAENALSVARDARRAWAFSAAELDSS